MNARTPVTPSREELLQLISSSLKIDLSQSPADVSLEDFGVDSLDLLRLSYAIERHYGVNLSGYSHTDFQSLERMLELLKQAIQAQTSQ